MQYLGSDDAGVSSFSLQDFEPSFGSKFTAAWQESWLESYGPRWRDALKVKIGADNSKKITAAEADSMRMEFGGFKMKDKPTDYEYTSGQWSAMLERQKDLAAIKDIRGRTPMDWGSVVRGGAMFGAGMADPVNLATAFVPWTRLLPAAASLRAATMAGSFATRTGARAVLGGADAGISSVVLEPFNYAAAQYVGDDYDALESMATIAFGTAFGAGIHVGGGALKDAYGAFRSWRGTASPMVTPNPSMETAAPLTGAVPGVETKVRVGDAYEPARWSVVEADTLQATVDKADNQFRDRSRPAYQAEIQSRANTLDPALVLADSPVMDIGAPTLAADGRIVGGNGRTLFISKAYEIGKGGDYRAALEARLGELGIDVDAVRGMKKPVLVRQFTRDVDVKRAAMLSNEGGATDMSPLEQAKVDAERLGDARLSVGADGDINNAENRAAIRKWVEAQPENKRNSIMDSDGKLSPEGLRRLNGAMLFKAYGDSPTLARLIEAVDPGSRNLALALGRTAPVIAATRQAIAAGDLHPLDIAADLQQAIEKYNQIREQGMKVPDYLAQLDAFGDGLTPEATMLLDFMGRNIQSPRRIMDAITGFADRLTEAGNPKQTDMFGAAIVPDKAAMLQDAITAAERGLDSAAEVVAGLAPETREAALRAAVAQSVDGRVVDVDAIIGMDESRGTHTMDDATTAADRNFEPESMALADMEASAAVQARVDAAPKWEAVKDAEDALAEADALLADTVKAGDQAFKYSRGEAAGQKKATLWQGTTARFSPEDGAPLGRFRWDFINSDGGEQAQAFGYGHYLAQQAWISQTRYRERLIGMKRGGGDSYAIPDGAGGVMTVSRRDNEPAWQMPDGSIVHTGQKNEKLQALAQAIDQVSGYGYARARETFEALIRGEDRFLESARENLQEAIDAEMPKSSITSKRNDIDRALAQQKSYRDALAAMDEVTVEARSAGTVDLDAEMGGAPLRVLAPGIQKYDPPVPENLRERVVVADGSEVNLPDVVLGWLKSEVSRNQLDYLPEFTQTLGRNLDESRNTQAGSNATIDVGAMVSKLIKEAASPQFLDPFIALQERGVKSVTLEMPGSLYRAEMAVEDFQNLMLWDAPMSEQPAVVREAFQRWGIEDGAMTGMDAYIQLTKKIDNDPESLDKSLDFRSAVQEAARRRGVDEFDASSSDFRFDELASIMLHNAGIPGHAFLDGVSRKDAESPSYNLVIYSDDVAKIVDRYARQTGEIGRATDTPEGLTEALRLSFGKSTERLLSEGRVQVVATPKDIPGGPHPGDVKAATAPDGTVYVVAQNVSELEARGIVLHEVGVHVGMENMLGTEVFGSVLSELDDAIARGESWAQAARSSVPADTLPAHVREEQLAYLVQNSPELPIVQRILAAVRAWAFRTFEIARERMTLTEADFRAMAVSALHAAARGQDVPEARFGDMAPRYSRGETPDPSTTKDELKPFDDAVKRAKSFASVLRAAADKLDNDAQATAAMRAAMPDITTQEIDDLLGQLRTQVRGLRGIARTARTAVTSEESAALLQTDAMKAADELANNLELAAVIEKRNASLNIAARLKATTYLNQFRDAKLDFEGFRGLLVGTERKRAGGRISVDAEQKNFRGEWLGGMISDLEKAGLMRLFTSGEFDREVYQALWNLGRDGAGNEKLPREAVAIADVVNKYQTDARNTRNRFGAWIRDLNGYITRQSHDMFKIRDAGEKAYKEAVLPLLDLQRSLRDFDGSADDFLTRVYDDFAAGSHLKTPAGEDDLQALGRGSSLARRESVSRVLYFKDGDAAYQYNQKFGQGRLAESVLGGLDNAAKSAGLLKLLGTNPEATVSRLFDEYAESLRGDPQRRAKFLSHRKELENLLAHVDGSVGIPGNVTAAQISSFLRSWQTMSKLGGMLISSVTDLANYAAELRFGQDKNLLTGTLEGMGALTRGRASGEKRAVLNSLGVFHESTLGAVFSRFDSPELMGGKTAWAMQQFFKLTGINWWTESLRDGYALAHASYVSAQAGKAFDKLPEPLRDMLGLYNIDAGKWDVLRLANTQQADGRMYITPEGLRTVPRAAFANYITQVGRSANDAAIANLQDDLAAALRTMTIDRMHHAVIEPGARTRAFMQRGTQPGTVTGELLRFVGQFKSFPVALVQMTLGREVYGRGYDTIGEYLRKGKGDMVGLATFIALSTAMGYAAMAAKDLLKGRNPRPVDDPRTWAAAMVQGGGLGLYGDFLFGKYNRMGGSLTGSMAGPVANLADTVADLWTRIRTGDDFGAVAFNAALQNTPFANLFYTRVALDYLILYQIQEALNPGFLRRMEKRLERDNGQTFYLPPSEVAR